MEEGGRQQTSNQALRDSVVHSLDLVGTSAWIVRRTWTRPPRASACGELTARQPGIGLRESPGVFYEREARAFAVELLMPFSEFRKRWFGLSPEGLRVEEMVPHLAEEFSDGSGRCAFDYNR